MKHELVDFKIYVSSSSDASVVNSAFESWNTSFA